jgi:hypothetical protein
MPLLLLNRAKVWPLISTEKVGEEMQAWIRLMKCLCIPLRTRAEVMKCHSILSKALAKSIFIIKSWLSQEESENE